VEGEDFKTLRGSDTCTQPMNACDPDDQLLKIASTDSQIHTGKIRSWGANDDASQQERSGRSTSK
jgi:hypothetical protein